jgi:hypothetical protein
MGVDVDEPWAHHQIGCVEAAPRRQASVAGLRQDNAVARDPDRRSSGRGARAVDKSRALDSQI